MFSTPLFSCLLVLLSLSATIAVCHPGAPTRLDPEHRMVRRSSDHRRRQWGHGGGHGGHGGKGGQKSGAGGGGKSSSSANAYTQETTSSAAAKTSSKAANKTTTTVKATSTSSSGTGDYTGEATFYYQEGGTGSCGNVNSDSAKIVALQYELYDASYCGKSLTITNTANGKSVTATVADECPGCASKYSLDLSTGCFDEIGDEDTGVLSISWGWD